MLNLRVLLTLSILPTLIVVSEPTVAESLPIVLSTPAVVSPLAPSSLLTAVTRAGDRLVAVGERGHILISLDNGRTWHQAKVPTSGTLTSVAFASPHVGWAVGHFGVVLGTQDSGETWQLQLDGARAAELIAKAAHESGETSRLQWAKILVADGPDKPLLTVVANDERTVLVFGAYGLALRSDDSGNSWRAIDRALDNPTGLHLNSAHRIDGLIYLVGEQGLLRRSDDGGRTFKTLKSPYDGSFFDVIATAEGTVIALALQGHAFVSNDKGETWSACRSVTDEALTSGIESSEGRVLISTAGGHLVRGDAACGQLSVIDVPGAGPLSGLTMVDAQDVLTVGASGIKHLNLSQIKKDETK